MSSQTETFEAIYEFVKKHGTTVPNKFYDVWLYKHDSGVEVTVRNEDAGYCQSVYVKGFLTAYLPYMGKIGYMFGDYNGVETIYRMLKNTE
jgi:hypothetical protein